MDGIVRDGSSVRPETPALLSAPAAVRPAFVALSRFVVANGMETPVKAAFRARPHRVDQAAGFVRMQVLCPLDRPGESGS
jgi:hypothetical protein